MKKLFPNPFSRCLTLIGFIGITSVSYAQQIRNLDNHNHNHNHNHKVVKAGSPNEIESLIDLSCDNSSQCKTIGFGHSPCGGHQKYLVYSEKSTDTALFKAKAEKYNVSQKMQHQKSGVAGVCVHIAAPKTHCSQSKCSAALGDPSLLR
jgi:hypothetical protein